jgi:succinoglycan biosynthesis transport protein ExoP
MVVVIAIPPVYQSTGTILVESQTIPTDLIPSTAASLIDERIEIIRQRVMTRENLFKIIEKYKLFRDTTQSIDSVRKDRRNAQADLYRIDRRQRQVPAPGPGTIAFKLKLSSIGSRKSPRELPMTWSPCFSTKTSSPAPSGPPRLPNS